MNHHSAKSTLAVMTLATLLTFGCAHTAEDTTPADEVAGYYDGHWYGPNPDKPLGTLNCTITPSGPDTWDAYFVATFGEVGEYEVPLQGRRENGKVIFGGDVDLGEEEGGVFGWTGEIVDGQFNGEYKAATYTGTFSMEKTDPPAE
jgi:hypothetical protein